MKETIVMLIVTVGLFVAGVFSGIYYHKQSSLKGVIKQQGKDATAVMEHKEKQKEVIKYVTKTKTVLLKIKDNSGCLDRSNAGPYLDSLLSADGQTKP